MQGAVLLEPAIRARVGEHKWGLWLPNEIIASMKKEFQGRMITWKARNFTGSAWQELSFDVKAGGHVVMPLHFQTSS